mgnify:CR=1 FL=1
MNDLRVIAHGTATAEERKIPRNSKVTLWRDKRKVGIYQNMRVAR